MTTTAKGQHKQAGTRGSDLGTDSRLSIALRKGIPTGLKPVADSQRPEANIR